MECDILACCHFVSENLAKFPKTSEYVKSRLCFGDYEKCNRHRTYLGFGVEDIPFDFDLSDTENMHKIRECLQNKATACK